MKIVEITYRYEGRDGAARERPADANGRAAPHGRGQSGVCRAVRQS